MSPKEQKAVLIKICHTLKSNKFPSDDNRKDYLYVNYGVESTKDLSIEQLKEFALYLGYGRKSATKPHTKEKAQEEPERATQKQIETIEGIWFKVARDKTDKALRAYIHRITGKRPLFLNSMSKTEAQKVITGLMRMQKAWRKEKDGNHHG